MSRAREAEAEEEEEEVSASIPTAERAIWNIARGRFSGDGNFYYIAIPKEVTAPLNMKGGEHFVVKVDPVTKKMSMALAVHLAKALEGY